MERIRLIAVVGPTACGKSDFAVNLALREGGEIVSCDSMQVYRGMDIGTAKPTVAERRGIPHHLIDVADPCDAFSVADYVALAGEAIRDVAARGKLPILCGGTGLYLDRLLFGGLPEEIASSPALRQELFAYADAYGNDALHRRLAGVDPESAAAIHPNNVRRVVRALEIHRLTGIPKSEWDRQSRSAQSVYDAEVIGLTRPREELRRRIALRVDRMLSDGLVEETARLERAGVFACNRTAAQAIGYKEILPYLHGECDLETAAESLRTATCQYAKRQYTWFRAKPYVRWEEAEGAGL